MKFPFICTMFLTSLKLCSCREADYEGYERKFPINQSAEDVFMNALRPQVFTVGTLIGLLVASMVVVIGSFLVFWRICCDVEMVVSHPVPLQCISVPDASRSSKCSSNLRDIEETTLEIT